ncbi:2-dehydropantoate 2-reductase [Pseudobutyrivibrio sp. NOR37]|nr:MULTISPECIES: 2-dehydropantoate 2-reductase N-terminal domain-containing protein [Pseudobutyrivibrio]SFR60105.1 2-dehydropantoate 2-reductase [Pseudobutyrivibrio sp. NOR37]
MRILILGRGVIGAQYGWALEQAGAQVDFLVRKGGSRNYADTLELHSYDGRKKRSVDEVWPINLRYDIPTEEVYDLVIVSVNPEQIAGAIETIAPVAGDATVLLMGNTMGNPLSRLKNLSGLSAEQFVIGFPGAGGGITDNVLHGILHGIIQLGVSEKKLNKREQAVKNLFESAGFKVSLHRDIDGWLVNHYVLNAAMEMEVLKRGSFEKVVQSEDGLTSMMENVKKMIPYLKAKGVRPDMAIVMMSILPARLLAGLMRKTIYKPGSPAYDAVAYNQYQVGYAVREIQADAKRLGMNIL